MCDGPGQGQAQSLAVLIPLSLELSKKPGWRVLSLRVSESKVFLIYLLNTCH